MFICKFLVVEEDTPQHTTQHRNTQHNTATHNKTPQHTETHHNTQQDSSHSAPRGVVVPHHCCICICVSMFLSLLLEKMFSLHSPRATYTVTHTHTHTHTCTQTDRQTDRQTQRQTQTQIHTRTLTRTRAHTEGDTTYTYGVATISRLLKIIGLFCERALQKRLYSAKETYNFKEPTSRSHPICIGRDMIYSYVLKGT